MSDWRGDALGAGFDIDRLAFAAEFVARGVAVVDGAPIEELPGFWVIPGFIPYDGRVILATADRRILHDDVEDVALQLTAILTRVVATCDAARTARG